MCGAKGIAFISADYRLLCPCTGLDQIDDVQALFRFLSGDVNSHLPQGLSINPSKIALAGVSAGGYIASLAALYAEPRPVAMLNYFGMGGDLLADYMIAVRTPEFIAKSGWGNPSEEEVLALGKLVPIAEDPMVFNPATKQMRSKLGRLTLFEWNVNRGAILDRLVGEEGISEQLRKQPYDERAVALSSSARKLFPQLHIDKNFPPTYLAHGDEDTLVLLSESEHMYRQLQHAGVRSELHVVPGAGHGFRSASGGGLAAGVDEVNRLGFEFLVKELAI